ncbi:MAG: hypothetical protein FWD47_04155 [Treponema sp.]|nr:hypothetical protein [Treponema sp.]
MKKLAKLIIFFTLTFIIVFLAATTVKYLSLRVEWAKSLSFKPETTITLMLSAAYWALSLSLFSTILMALNYVVRKGYSAFLAVICIMVMSFFYSYGISIILNQWKSMPPAESQTKALGSRGLKLSQNLTRSDSVIVLLNGAEDPYGPRLTAISGQPFIYHQSVNTDFELPPVPFGDETPQFLKSLSIDLRLNAQRLNEKFNEGFDSFLIYAGSLIFLLCSLGYAVKFSVWPLANLFLATLAFRGILAFETFFNTPEILGWVESFLGSMLPVTLALPALFLGFGLLLNVYSLLSFASRRRFEDD